MDTLRRFRASLTNSPSRASLLALLLPLALSLAAEPNREAKEAPRMQLWVPAYYYPAGEGLKEWDRLMKSGRQAPIVVVVNPASGPGKKADPNYVAITKKARTAGLTLVGYVSSQYARKSRDALEAEVNDWVRFYPHIQGIHVDEQSSEAARAGYYKALYRYIRGKIPHALVLSNPGTNCAADYLNGPCADAVCLFERDRGFEDFLPAVWTRRFPPHRFGVLAYNVATADTMRASMQAAVRHRVGYAYFTDAKGSNPYDRLPSYWDEEVAAVRQINQVKKAR